MTDDTALRIAFQKEAAKGWLQALDKDGRRTGVFGLTFGQYNADASFWYTDQDRMIVALIADDITPELLARVVAVRDAQEAETEAQDGGGWSAGAIMTTKDMGFECEMHGYYLEKYLTGRGWHVYSVWMSGEYGSPQS